MKQNLTAVVFSIAIVLASIILGYSYFNRTQPVGNISVTGLGEKNFTSDLIVWEGNFTKSNYNIQKAYSQLKVDKKTITEYLAKKGIAKDEIVFSAVNSDKETRTNYSSDGKYIGSVFVGYRLNQTLTIESNNVEKVENLSREITELLNEGIEFYSESPRYYYTKLANLKIEMISRATEDARVRAEKIAENSGSKLGKLISAKMGIFQITGQNSNEDYSWGGTFNTSSKEKTASITMKLTYGVK
jgi:hypothetical protein